MILPRTRFESSGTRTESVGASPAATTAALGDRVFVTDALGDLLDQQRSTSVDPVWVLPAMSIGPRRVTVVLEPTWTRGPGDVVVIEAVAVPPSDVDAILRLDCAAGPAPTGDGGRLTIDWSLRMWPPVPRALAAAVRPALDGAVGRVVDRVFARIVAGVEGA